MRIIAGVLKGRTWALPKGLEIRPTTDRAKESLFNVLQAQMDWTNALCLDAFAGTGSIGFEMLSRGAKEVYFLDKNQKSIQHIQRQLDTWKLNNTKALQTDVFEFAFRQKMAFDLIFLDPPYTLDEALKLPEQFISNGLLKKEGVLVLEHGPNWVTQISTMPGLEKTKKYGHVHFSYFRNEE
ncbi:MAG: 16S rRNA (guanine(966)-N(2))-methyltransferase RsmD [Bacteroidetes bacterium]|nr:16S rRNA (guanine(966)-N(2))-methyltransferase RsmD [Bacteroidota bacterium]